MRISKHLNPCAIKGLTKVADVSIPGNKLMPKFSETSFIQQIDRMLDPMPKEDVEGLNILLAIFRYLPSFCLKALLLFLEMHDKLPDFLGSPMRMVDIALKGLVRTLYFSNLEDPNRFGEKILEQMNWKTGNREILEDSEMRELIENNDFNSESCLSPMEKARRIQPEIANLSLKERIAYLKNIKEFVLENKEALIDAIQLDTQKCRSDALMSEVFGILDHLDFLIKNAKKHLGNHGVKTPLALMGKKSIVSVEPLGVMLIISPWNYPLYQALVPITTSFICANATLYKPSELTPLQGIVENLLSSCGFKKDWVQILYGDGGIAQDLIDQKPDKIFFTGSVSTGKKIMAQASNYLIPVELELGGKDPMIVFEDVNIQRAARGALWGAMTNTGQSCTSVERLYIHEEIYTPFKEELIQQTQSLKQIVDKDGDSDLGYMTSQTQVKIVREHLEDALQKGAIQLTGMDWDKTSKKIPPILLENITPEMKLYYEETFGPILPIMSFDSQQEVLEAANDSEFGLSASIWSKDKKKALRLASKLKTGNVSINNVMLTEGNHHLPFGGVKNSGIGRYKGRWGLESFSNTKAILVDSDSKKIEANWYPYTKKKYELFSGMTNGLFGSGLKTLIQFALKGLKLEGYSQKAKRK